MDPPPTDAEALARSLHDPAAFEVLFERHFDAVHRYLRHRAAHAADDLAAETFARAFAGRARVRSASVRAWLFGIATKLVADEARKRVRGERALARLRPGASAPDLADEAVARADAARLGPALTAAVADLRREDRDVLLLYAWADLSYEEVAEALSLPVGTVRSRLSRVRARLDGTLPPSARPLSLAEERR